MTSDQQNESDRKVDFIVAGTQKGGTTVLDHYLRQHPDIRMATKKEVHFFDEESCFQDEPDYSHYHSAFDWCKEAEVTGEVTPIYMYWNPAAGRIREYNSDMRVIFILRNPVERAFSHWNMERERGNEDVSFMEAITSEHERCKQSEPLQHRVYSYLDRGFFTVQLERFWQFIPRSQTLVLRNEDLRSEPEATMLKVTQFLGVPQYDSLEPADVFSTPYSRDMTVEERTCLIERYQHEIRKLERLLGWNCSDWLS